jgi:glucosamine kinase
MGFEQKRGCSDDDMSLILAIDGGGSRTRCTAFDEGGNVLGTGESGPSNHLLVDRGTVAESIGTVIDQTLAASDRIRGDASLIAAGLAGVDYDGTGEAEMRELFWELGFKNTLIEGDMVMAHAGALAGEPGVLALAGTGSSVLGIDDAGKRIKVGGWGPVFGDEGSAYWIGQSALRAAARDFDGRGPRTELTNAIVKALGLNSFGGTVESVYVQAMEPREIAKFSRAAYAVAEMGDPVAVSIFETAGKDLAECVEAAIIRFGVRDGRTKVSFEGSVITSCTVMRDSFCKYLQERFSSVEIVPPSLSPVAGAYLLGRKKWGLENPNGLLQKLRAKGN